MSDRSSAELFGTIFELLAENPTDEHKRIAREMFDKSRDYDFNEYQMDCDDALMKLGLARKGVDPEYPDDGEVTLYGPESEKP